MASTWITGSHVEAKALGFVPVDLPLLKSTVLFKRMHRGDATGQKWDVARGQHGIQNHTHIWNQWGHAYTCVPLQNMNV